MTGDLPQSYKFPCFTVLIYCFHLCFYLFIYYFSPHVFFLVCYVLGLINTESPGQIARLLVVIFPHLLPSQALLPIVLISKSKKQNQLPPPGAINICCYFRRYLSIATPSSSASRAALVHYLRTPSARAPASLHHVTHWFKKVAVRLVRRLPPSTRSCRKPTFSCRLSLLGIRAGLQEGVKSNRLRGRVRWSLCVFMIVGGEQRKALEKLQVRWKSRSCNKISIILANGVQKYKEIKAFDIHKPNLSGKICPASLPWIHVRLFLGLFVGGILLFCSDSVLFSRLKMFLVS